MTVAGLSANKLHDFLINNSELNCLSVTECLPIIVKLYACNSGGTSYQGNNVATDLSVLNPNAEIIAPTKVLTRYGVRADGFFVSYKNGVKSLSNINFLNNGVYKIQNIYNSQKGIRENWKIFKVSY